MEQIVNSVFSEDTSMGVMCLEFLDRLRDAGIDETLSFSELIALLQFADDELTGKDEEEEEEF